MRRSQLHRLQLSELFFHDMQQYPPFAAHHGEILRRAKEMLAYLPRLAVAAGVTPQMLVADYEKRCKEVA